MSDSGLIMQTPLLPENLLLCEGFQLAKSGRHPKWFSEAVGWGLSLFHTCEETEVQAVIVT